MEHLLDSELVSFIKEELEDLGFLVRIYKNNTILGVNGEILIRLTRISYTGMRHMKYRLTSTRNINLCESTRHRTFTNSGCFKGFRAGGYANLDSIFLMIEDKITFRKKLESF